MEKIKTLLKKLSPYIIVIFITINVHDFIVQTSNNTTFVNNFNFASTITSIILSVVAIIYTLIDGSQSKGIQTKIVEAADDIQQSVNELKEVSSRMKDINKKINQLEENIKQSNSELAATLTYKKGVTKHDIDNTKSISEELDQIIGNFSIESIRNCFLFYKAFKENVSLDIVKFNEYYNDVLKSDNLPSMDIKGSILSTLDIFSSLGYIEYTLSGKNLTIVDFDKQLENSLKIYIPEENYYSDSYDARLFGTVYSYFNK